MKRFVFTPPHEIRDDRTSPPVYRRMIEGRQPEDNGIFRAQNPERKRSVPLAAPHRVDTLRSRGGQAHLEPGAWRPHG